MSRGSAWAARRDGAFTSVEDPQQRRLAEWMDQDKQEVLAAVASEVSAAVAAALQSARAGHHEYLDLAPTTTSTPTASVADYNASIPDASMVVSAKRSTSASTQQQQQQQQQQEDEARVMPLRTQSTMSLVPGRPPHVRRDDKAAMSPYRCQRPFPPQHQRHPRSPSVSSPSVTASTSSPRPRPRL